MSSSASPYFGSKSDQLFPTQSSYNLAIAQLADRLRVSHLTVPAQVHGSDVLVLDGEDEWVVHCDNPFTLPASKELAPIITDTLQVRTARADAVVSSRSSMAIGVLTADCAPLLVCDPVSGVFGAIHAGWRSSAGGIVLHTLLVMETIWDVPVADMQVWIGPSARVCCYEVGAEFGDHLSETAWQRAVVQRQGKYYFDNVAYIRQQLASWGIAGASIIDDRICTICNPSWWSHRRDGAAAGRQVSVICG